MGAALKIFAEEGYVGAKTRIIAKEAGFSEMTLFRKFKSKENLFDTILMEKKGYLMNEANTIFSSNNSENPEESFRLLIQHLYNLIEENFPYISLYINERRRVSENILDELVIYLSRQIEFKFHDCNVNTKVFAFSILSFLYHLVFDQYKDYSFMDHTEAINEFTDKCIVILTS